jgi:Subtilase family/Peptidase inhibitor I9
MKGLAMLSLRPRHLAFIALATLLPAAMSSPALAVNAPSVVHRGEPSVLSQAEVERLAANAAQRSIVIFKNQHPEAPERVASTQRAQVVEADQAAVKSELSQLNTRDVKSFHLVNAVAATISQAEVNNLAANPDVQAVVPDLVRSFVPKNNTGPGHAGRAATGVQSINGPQPICPPDPKVPLLEPEALQVMNVEFQPGTHQPAAHDLVDGIGVKVGIIADGLDPTNPDLQRNGSSVVFDFRDFSGFGNNAPTNGSEAFLDAGAIASQGTEVYDLAGFVNPAYPLPPGHQGASCNIRIKGVAPGASLAVMNVLGSNAGAFNSQIIQAIEWAVGADDVDVLNESFAGNPLPDTRNDPVQLANAAAVAAGVVVVVSTGDSGPTGTTGSPATGDGIIAAAGTTTFRLYRQTTSFATQLTAGGWLSNNITALSSGGTSEFGPRAPDIAAPGDSDWELCSTDTAHFFGCADILGGANPPAIQAAGGTSLSAPLVSGTAALVIQAYASTHDGTSPTPELVKRIIVSTAGDLGAPADHQGAGLVNSLRAVQLAESIHDDNGSPTRQGDALLVNRPNITATVPAGGDRTFSVEVTNDGASQQKLSPTLVALGGRSVSDETGTLALSSASPTFTDGQGNTDFYALHEFDVPAGVDYLNGDIVWNAQATTSAVFETLFDPLGRVAAFSLLGNDFSGRGHVEVRQPSPGRWRAAIFTVNNDFVYSGDVHFSFSTQKFHSAGTVAPAHRTLEPGQSATFRVSVEGADQAGDHVSTLRLTTDGTASGSLPVIIRSLVPIDTDGGSLGGTLTGGASQLNAGQRLTYQFDVPANKPSLNIALQLHDPDYDVRGFLTDPHGEPLDIQSTAVFTSFGNFVGFGPTMQIFHQAPAAGRWTLSLLVFTAIDGAHLSEPFSANINFRRPVIQAHGLPTSPSTQLKAGQPVNATIDIMNSGNAFKDFFADARLKGKTYLTLAGADVNGVALPLSVGAQPNWLVPPHSDTLIVAAQGTVRIAMDISAANGDPDRLGQALPTNFDLATLRAPEIAPGFFFALPEAQGPFPIGGVGGGARVNLAAIANTNPFDSAVSADSGDVWAQSVDPTAGYTPLTLGPGQPGAIKLTITPNAPVGTVVRGFIAVDTFNLDTFAGDELVLLPYSYTVK